MARRKGESQQEHMDRIRAARGLPPLTRERLFEEVAAARAYFSSDRHNRPGTEMQAFMHIFHPGHPLTGTTKGLMLAREMDSEARR